ncbi:MAG: peptidylprolyl isomerase [Planctomycetaceae bacterium]|nr:peptidylprolyl isomerase [Planctomycetaceae bacterium]
MNFTKLLSSLLTPASPCPRRLRKSRYAPDSIETLESRNLLSGNVMIELSGGNLKVVGDQADNNVLIISENGDLIARGIDGTTINGSDADFVLLTGSTTIERDLFATMRGGSDTLTFSGMTVNRNVLAFGGSGNDKMGFNDVAVGGHLRIYSQSGDDGIWLNDVSVDRSITVNSGIGNDTVFIDNTQAAKSIVVIAPWGNNNLRLDHLDIGDDLVIITGQKDDNIELSNSVINDDLLIITGHGSDAVRLSSVHVIDDATLILNGGNDQAIIGDGTAIDDDLLILAGAGSDSVEVENSVMVSDTNRQRSVASQTVDANVFTTRFDDNTTGLFALTDTLRQGFVDLIEPEDLTLVLDTSNSGAIQSSNTLLTNQATFTIDGTTLKNATVEIDADGDNEYDDGTATADENGVFTVTTMLPQNGANQISVRVTDRLNRTVDETLDVHLAAGTVSRFTTSAGTFDVELLDADAPITVANFLNYDQRYDDSIIHRSAFLQSGGDFIIQGGGFRLNPDLERIPIDAPIQNEFRSAHSNVRGTISVALAASPNSGTSQWFFNTADNSFLDNNQHTVFGFVIGSGMEVVDLIHDLPTFNMAAVLDDSALTDVPLDRYSILTQELTGTVETTANSTTVQGTGTLFTTEVNVGQRIKIDDEIYTVVAIASDTELTLNVPTAEAFSGIPAKINAVPSSDQYITITDIDSALFG